MNCLQYTALQDLSMSRGGEPYTKAVSCVTSANPLNGRPFSHLPDRNSWSGDIGVSGTKKSGNASLMARMRIGITTNVRFAGVASR